MASSRSIQQQGYKLHHTYPPPHTHMITLLHKLMEICYSINNKRVHLTFDIADDAMESIVRLVHVVSPCQQKIFTRRGHTSGITNCICLCEPKVGALSPCSRPRSQIICFKIFKWDTIEMNLKHGIFSRTKWLDSTYTVLPYITGQQTFNQRMNWVTMVESC